jgi:hypothetical protein
MHVIGVLQGSFLFIVVILPCCWIRTASPKMICLLLGKMAMLGSFIAVNADFIQQLECPVQQGNQTSEADVKPSLLPLWAFWLDASFAELGGGRVGFSPVPVGLPMGRAEGEVRKSLTSAGIAIKLVGSLRACW